MTSLSTPAQRISASRLATTRRRLRRHVLTLALLTPALGLFALFYVVPNILTFAYAFTDWSTYKDEVNWVGLDNFTFLSQQGVLWQDLQITLKYAAVVMVVQNLVALTLALALERASRINTTFRAIFFLPVLLSPLAAGYIWRGVYAEQGVLNDVLSVVTFSNIDFAWLGSTTWTLFMVAIIQAWKSSGINMLVYIAALNAVPNELVEAARVEGASTWRIIRKIKLPLIAPAFTFNITLTLIGALSTFDMIIATTRGGPAGSTEVLNMYVWQQWGTGAWGFATAISLVLFLMTSLAAFPLIAFLRRREIQL